MSWFSKIACTTSSSTSSKFLSHYQRYSSARESINGCSMVSQKEQPLPIKFIPFLTIHFFALVDRTNFLARGSLMSTWWFCDFSGWCIRFTLQEKYILFTPSLLFWTQPICNTHTQTQFWPGTYPVVCFAEKNKGRCCPHLVLQQARSSNYRNF